MQKNAAKLLGFNGGSGMISLLDIMNPFDAFSFSFFNRALLIVAILSLVLPLVGVRLAGRGASMIADTLSHTSLAGIAIGLISGGLPMVWAIVFSAIASILIEAIRRKFPKYSELSLTIILSFSLGLTGILGNFSSSSRFESYLFGSLFTVSWDQVIALGAICAAGLVYEILFYRSNMLLSYSEIEAKANGVKVVPLSLIDTVITSMIVAAASNTIGSLLVSSFISIPVACALRGGKSNFMTNILAIVCSLASAIVGLFLAFSISLHVGGVIVMVNLIVLIVTIIITGIRKRKKPKGS